MTKNFKVVGEKWMVTCRVTSIRLPDFSAETLQAKKGNGILRTLIEEKCQARILYLGKLPCRHEEEIKAVSEQ